MSVRPKKMVEIKCKIGVTHFSSDFIGSIPPIHRPFPRAINHPALAENKVFPAFYR